jgi:hypothetical protein
MRLGTLVVFVVSVVLPACVNESVESSASALRDGTPTDDPRVGGVYLTCPEHGFHPAATATHIRLPSQKQDDRCAVALTVAHLFPNDDKKRSYRVNFAEPEWNRALAYEEAYQVGLFLRHPDSDLDLAVFRIRERMGDPRFDIPHYPVAPHPFTADHWPEFTVIGAGSDQEEVVRERTGRLQPHHFVDENELWSQGVVEPTGDGTVKIPNLCGGDSGAPGLIDDAVIAVGTQRVPDDICEKATVSIVTLIDEDIIAWLESARDELCLTP